VQVDLGAQQRGEGVNRRGGALQLTEEDACGNAVQRNRLRHKVTEVPRGIAIQPRQRHPQLYAVQHRRRGRRHLGVADACPRRHQVQLTGMDEGMRAAAVAVLDLAFEKPTHRLQSGMRVGWHDHARAATDVVRPVVVDEAPCADERTLPLRQGSADSHRTRPTQWNVASGQHLDTRLRGCRAGLFDRRSIQVAHRRDATPLTRSWPAG
jgi:hypothetical protein